MKMNLETERLIIRNLVPEDYKDVYKWCGDPKVNTYMIYPIYHCEEEVKKWLETLDEEEPNSYEGGWVCKETGELIGSGGLVYQPEKDVWIIGYNLRADQWGNGYTVEALEGIMDYIRGCHHIHAIEGRFAIENHNSKRVMEKLGMTFHRDSEYEKLDGSVKFKANIYRKEYD